MAWYEQIEYHSRAIQMTKIVKMTSEEYYAWIVRVSKIKIFVLTNSLKLKSSRKGSGIHSVKGPATSTGWWYIDNRPLSRLDERSMIKLTDLLKGKE
jgi:hypothetical protein